MNISADSVRIWGRKVEIIVLLAIASAMVRLLPFRWLKKTMGDVGEATSPAADPMALPDDAAILKARQIGRHISQMSKRVPFKAVCLPQAMTGRWMLARRRQKSQIFIGVRKVEHRGSIDLHAWLVTDGHCITGDQERRGFIQFERTGLNNSEPS